MGSIPRPAKPGTIRSAEGHRDNKPRLVGMMLFRVTFTALTGYGLGVGLCAFLIRLARLRLPIYAATITFSNLAIAFRGRCCETAEFLSHYQYWARRVVENPFRYGTNQDAGCSPSSCVTHDNQVGVQIVGCRDNLFEWI